MELTTKKVYEMLSAAYDSGYQGDGREETVALILSRYEITEELDKQPAEEEERIYTVEELRELPPGTIFLHPTLGLCKIKENSNGNKIVAFDEPKFEPAALKSNEYPWDIPMKRIHS